MTISNEQVKNKLQSFVNDENFDINTTESQNQLFNYIKNLSSSLSNNDIANNYQGIRCLSLIEYNKFIINGTLDGSITKNNINVWHYENRPHSLSHIAVYGGGTYSSFRGYGIVQGMYNYDNGDKFVIYTSEYYFSLKSYSYTLNNELLQNNENNNFYLSNTVPIAFDCVVFFNGKSSGKGTIYLGKNVKINKNLTNNSYTTQASIGVFSGPVVCKIDLKVVMNFRPVFQYIDNHKSKNIFE